MGDGKNPVSTTREMGDGKNPVSTGLNNYCKIFLISHHFMDDELYQNKYRIRSTRATWWNYNEGTYFITICTKDKFHYFGEIVDEEMILSTIGKKTVEYITAIPSYYPQVIIVNFVVMPNHVHLVLIINSEDIKIASTNEQQSHKSKLLPSIIGNFKASVTRFARSHQIPFSWQSRYHDHIIRNQEELSKITDYVLNNVHRWSQDRYHAE